MAHQTTMDMLQTSLRKTHEWLTDFIDHTGRKDEEKAWQMMRGVMHVLRDRLTTDQCAHLSAQLPLVIRGLYFEGWKPSRQPTRLRSREEFLQAVAEEVAPHPDIDPGQAIQGTFHVFSRRISAGELNKIKQEMPEELRGLWPAC